jgi:putative tricarboxylic transport membrane protein
MKATFRDRLGSIIMLVFIAILWVQRGYTTPFGGIFPDRVMIIMTIFVIITLILSFTRYRTMKEGDEKKEAGKEEDNRWLEMAVVIVIMMFWVLLLRYAGFVLSGVAGFSSIAWYISGQRKDWKTVVKALLVGLAITYLIVFIFGHLLKVPLPQGDLFG